LDLSAQQWADRAGPKSNGYQSFLAFARDAVEALHEGTGWEVEYPRDTWRLERLPGLTANASKPSPRSRVHFEPISQPVYGCWSSVGRGCGSAAAWPWAPSSPTSNH
jgi:hypothetical protein